MVRIGYIGSYARGDWGVGSDVDLIIVVRGSEALDLRQAAAFDATSLQVPADVLVDTLNEWDAIETTSRFYETVRREAVWVYPVTP